MFYVIIFVVLIVLTLTPPMKNSKSVAWPDSNVLVKRLKYPSFGTCWTDALRYAKIECDILDLDSQKYLALRFTDCFLVMSGEDAYGCGRLFHSNERNECIKTMSTRDYNTFTDFFTHVDNLCRFLEIQVWQEDTELKVSNLLASSVKTRRMLEEALQKQKLSLQLQLMSTSEQLQIMKSTSRLDERMFQLQSKTEQTVGNFSKSTSGSYSVLMETFTGLSALRQWLSDKTSWLETVIFYICCILVILLLTSLPELEEVKWILFSLLVAILCVECGLWSVSVYSDDVWLARNALVCISAGLLWLSACRYRDAESTNCGVMLEIERNIDHLEKMMLQTSLSENTEFIQSMKVASSTDRLSITPDKTSASLTNSDDKSWRSLRFSVTPDKRNGDEVIRNSPCRSVVLDKMYDQSAVSRQRNSPRLGESHCSQDSHSVESRHKTLRTRRAANLSIA